MTELSRIIYDRYESDHESAEDLFRSMLANKRFALAYHLYSLGLSIVPLSKKKRAVVKWKKFQTERCTIQNLVEWFFDSNFIPGIVTGEISGIVVIDCDSVDAIDDLLDSNAEESRVTQTTRRGRHFIYRHPGIDTRNRQGLGRLDIDVRGDGGLVVAYEDSMAWEPYDIAEAPIYGEPVFAS